MNNMADLGALLLFGVPILLIVALIIAFVWWLL